MNESRIRWIAIAAIVALAALLRLYQLDTLPSGMHGDEAFWGLLAERVTNDRREQNPARIGFLLRVLRTVDTAYRGPPLSMSSGLLYTRIRPGTTELDQCRVSERLCYDAIRQGYRRQCGVIARNDIIPRL
mgnify:CR=1 FL=1